MLRRWLIKLFDIPHADKEYALRARFFIALNLAFLVLSLLSIPSTLYFSKTEELLAALTMTLSLSMINVLGIVFTKLRKLDFAAILVSAVYVLSLTLGAIFLDDQHILWFSSFAMLIASFVLSAKAIWLVFAVQLAGLALMAYNIPDIAKQPDKAQELIIIAIFTIALTTIAYIFRLFNLRFVQRVLQTTKDLQLAQAQAEADRLKAESAAKEALIARAKAEDASLAKSRFLATMSHELRTPLNAIIGYAEIIEEELEDHSELEQLSHDAQHIYDAGRHLLGLINDILDLSKIEAGHMQVFVEPFDLYELLQSIVHKISPLVKKNQNDLKLDIQLDSNNLAQDRGKLQQVILNLLSNATKFTQDGTITLRAYEQHHHIIIEVQDTGIGISEEAQKRLFEPFVQADSSTTRRYGGTGLGLALCKQLTELLNGSISCKSTLGAGTTFRVELPRRRTNTPISTIDLKRIDFNKRALVLGGDAARNARRVKELQRAGWACTSSVNPQEGVKLIQTYNPHAVVLLLEQAPHPFDWSLLERIERLSMDPTPSLIALLPEGQSSPPKETASFACLTSDASEQQLSRHLKQPLSPRA